VYADAEGEPAVSVGDAAHRAEHAFLVVAHGAGHAGNEDDLPAVVVDVGPEERHAVLVGRDLRVGDELAQRVGDVLGPLTLEQLVGAVEVEERDRGLPVLRVLASGEQVGPDGGGDEAGEVDVADRRGDGEVFVGGGRPPHPSEPEARAVRLAEEVPRKRRRGGRAHDHLARARGTLHVREGRDRGAGEEQLAVRVADEEARERAGVDPGGHAQHDPPGARLEPTDVGEARLHPERGPRGASRVARAGEEQEECVAAELQEPAAGPVRDLQQRLEAGPDRVGDLLGTDLAVPGEALGHLREAGDVDEQQGALDRAGGLVGVGVGPVDGEPGDVGEQRPVPGSRAGGACVRTCCPHFATHSAVLLVPEARAQPTGGGSQAGRRGLTLSPGR
jgi:hypothetical protein